MSDMQAFVTIVYTIEEGRPRTHRLETPEPVIDFEEAAQALEDAGVVVAPFEIVDVRPQGVQVVTRSVN